MATNSKGDNITKSVSMPPDLFTQVEARIGGLRIKNFSEYVRKLLERDLAGCASSSFKTAEVPLAKYHAVRYESRDLYFEKYKPQLNSVFSKHGFTITTNAAPDVLLCKLDFSGGVSIRAHASLWDGETMVVAGEAYNGGWGTMLASSGAKDGVIEAAIRRLDGALKKSKP